jgi:hypothetical protein
MMQQRAGWLLHCARFCCDVDRGEVNRMSKSKDTKKDQKKAPQKTAKEKKQAKRDKQAKSSTVLAKTAGS